MCSTQGGPLHECLFVYCLYLNHKRARETCSEHATDSSTFPTQTHFISSRKVIKIPGTDVDNHALMGAACFRLYLRYVFPVITDAMSAEVRERDKEREVLSRVWQPLSLSRSLLLSISRWTSLTLSNVLSWVRAAGGERKRELQQWREPHCRTLTHLFPDNKLKQPDDNSFLSRCYNCIMHELRFDKQSPL